VASDTPNKGHVSTKVTFVITRGWPNFKTEYYHIHSCFFSIQYRFSNKVFRVVYRNHSFCPSVFPCFS